MNLAPGVTATFSHETFFSPVGGSPVQQPFRNSVPDPTRITLDPVVVAQSVAITAGVILLVPFPSALFNSTLEENYDGGHGWRCARARVAGRDVAPRSGVVRARSRQDADRAHAGAVTAARSDNPQPICGPAGESPPFNRAGAHETCGARPRDARLRPAQRAPVCLPRPDVRVQPRVAGHASPAWQWACSSSCSPTACRSSSFAAAQRSQLTVRALPATLLVGVLCVLVSRIADFQPGYLYGLIIGFFFARGVDRARRRAAPRRSPRLRHCLSRSSPG